MIDRLILDKSNVYLSVFDKEEQDDTEAEAKFTKVDSLSLAPYISGWDEEDWERVFLHIEPEEHLSFKKGQHVGLVYESTRTFTSEEQKYWPHIPNEKLAGEPGWQIYFDRTTDDGVMSGVEEMTSTGWSVNFIATKQLARK